MFLGFIHSIALLVAGFVVYSLLPYSLLTALQLKKPYLYQVLSGFLFGLLGIVVMISAQTFFEGLIFDIHSVVLCAAGVLCGPVTAVVAALLCAVYRFWLGGTGMLVGICVIAESAFFGAVYSYFRHRDVRFNAVLPLWGLGVFVHIIMLALMLALPGGIAVDVLKQISIPLILVFPLGFVVICRIFIQIESRSKVEKKLLESERQYRELVELAGSIIVRWQPDGTILYVNEGFLSLLGYSREELLGKSLPDFMLSKHNSSLHTTHAITPHIIDNQAIPTSHDIELVCKDGSRTWVNWTGKMLCDSAGSVTEILSVGIDCTERKRMEEQFWQSQEQNLRIVETANEGIWSLDSTFCTTFMNRKNYELLRYDVDDILGRPVENFLFQEDIPLHAERMAYCMQGESSSYEQRFVCHDGSELWTLVSATPVLDAQGRFDGLFFMVTDITVQKQLQFSLVESEKKYRMLFEHMTQGVFYQSFDGSLTEINPVALNMFGLTKTEFLERTSDSPAWDVMSDSGSRLLSVDHPSMQALKTGKPVKDVTLRVFNTRLGDYVWLNVNAVPRFNSGESVPCEVIVTLHDISESRKIQTDLLAREQQIRTLLEEAQQARRTLLSILEDDREINESLQQSEERYRSVVETAIDAIITVDNVGNIVLWNRAASKIFGYEPDEITGAPFSTLFSNDVEDQDVRSLLEAVKSGVLPTPLTVNEVVALKKNNALFPIEIAFGIVTQDQGRHITAIIRDITERKLMEQESLRSAQLVSIGELAAGVAHEINNPIMGVINYAQILLNTIREQGGDGDIPVRIIKEGERIASIVSNLLNLARPATSAAVAVSVREIFEPVYQLMQKRISQSDVVVDVHFCDNQPRALVVPQKIQQVFINLFSNAIFALDERFPDSHRDKRLEVSVEELCEMNQKYLRVIFLDYGCGISSENISRICNPFFSTKPLGKGTGLGLSICHEIISQHGGRLLFESELGQYTRVIVDLPTEG